MRYELRDPRWHIIVDSDTGYRWCSLYDRGQELDPFEESDLNKIHQILPDLMSVARTVLESYDRQLWPEMVLYADRNNF